MKKKVLAIVLTAVLTLSMGLVLAGPVGAAAGDVLYGTVGGKYLVTIDHTTGDATEVAMMSGYTGGGVYAIAFDSNTGTLYGLARDDGSFVPKLATLNVCTGEVTIIGNIELGSSPTEYTEYLAEGIAIDSRGKLWAGTSYGISRFEPQPTFIETHEQIPAKFALRQNYPNPFNSETTIEFTLPQECKINLVIYNIMGQKVRTLLSENIMAGHYHVRWDGRDEYGKSVSSGIYFAHLRMGSNKATLRMMLLK